MRTLSKSHYTSFSNYLWLEVLAVTPRTEYYKVKYSVD